MVKTISTPTTPNLVGRDTCRHNCAVERGLTVGFCGQLHHCHWCYYPAAWFQSPSSVMVSAEPFSDRSWPMPCTSSQAGPCQITDMWLWPAADYEPYRGCVSIDKVQWRTTTTSWSWRWCSHVDGVYSDYSIHEMKWMKYPDGWPCLGLTLRVGHLSRYVTSHQSWVGAMSTSQRAVTPCGWGVNAGMVHVWVAGKTVWLPCYTPAVSEHFRAVAYLHDKALHKFTLLNFTLTETVVTITAAKHGQHLPMHLWYTCTV